jgi:cell wall-associated NlpC family hydrolase
MNIERYKGLPYTDHGRDMSGVDCWGLVCLVYREQLGVELPGWSAEYEQAHTVSVPAIRHCFKGWKEVVGRPAVGDLALFEIKSVFHVGIVLDRRGKEMLHITKGRQVTIERVQSLLYRNCFRGFYHYER